MYYDLLARIKNAFLAEKISLLSPFSKMDFEIAKILAREKYLKEVQKKVVNRKNFLEIKLAYQNHKPSFRDFKIMSQPGRHLYRRHQDIRPVKNGYGLAILSTSKGMMDNKEAKKNKVGGEYLFEIW
mgnify:CR=1 FL=1